MLLLQATVLYYKLCYRLVFGIWLAMLSTLLAKHIFALVTIII